MTRLKESIDQYRNIKGIYFEMWTAAYHDFEQEIKEAKRLGLKYRIIDGQFYRERKKS